MELYQFTMVKIFMFFSLFFFLVFGVFSEDEAAIDCSFKLKSEILPSEKVFFYTNALINGNIFLEDSMYGRNYALVCSSEFIQNFDVNYVSIENNCEAKEQEIFNLGESIRNSGIYFLAGNDFASGNENKKMCLRYSDSFSSYDVEFTTKNLSEIGYQCLFKMNNLISSKVSDCSNNLYENFFWIKPVESESSLTCNNKCTSSFDDRVYSACSKQIRECSNVPYQCDGSILGGWVSFNNSFEVQCSPPWNNKRASVFTNEKVTLDVLDECLVSRKKIYPVIIDNQLVNMNILMCRK